LINGNGLVYNLGEPVEVYTNFLWTIIIALGMVFIEDPVIFSQIISIAFYCLSAAILIKLSHHLYKENGLTQLVIPCAAIFFLLHRELHIFATSGLETMMATALILSGFCLLTVKITRVRIMLSGLILTAAVMTRPDMAIFYGCSFIYIILFTEHRIRNAILLSGSFILFYIPYWIMKFQYYGYAFPNSFYAKSGGSTYFSQGFTYVYLYFKTYFPLFLLVPLIIYFTILIINKFPDIRQKGNLPYRLAALSILFITAYIFYVLKVGGDFMFGRFMIPITPICLIFLEISIIALISNPKVRVGLVIVLALAFFFRFNQFDSENKSIKGITDEYYEYPSELIDQARSEGAILKKYLSGLDVSSAFYGKKAMLVYYSEIANAQEAAASLTDVYMAHQPLAKRGRPGHEKRMSYDYLIDRKTNFLLGGTLNPTNDPNIPGFISFDGVIAHIIVYENEVMEKLKKYPEIKFLDFPALLDKYIANFENIPKAQAIKDYPYFEKYYFAHNKDESRKASLLNYINN